MSRLYGTQALALRHIAGSMGHTATPRRPSLRPVAAINPVHPPVPAEVTVDPWRLQAEAELFLVHFTRWRVAICSAIGLTVVVGWVFFHLTKSHALWGWVGLQTGAYIVQGVACRIYERQPPVPGSVQFHAWMRGWVALTVVSGLTSGALMLFVPGDQIVLLLAAAIIGGTFAVGEVSACGHKSLVYAVVASQGVMASVALAFHARLPFGVIICALFSGLLLHFGLVLHKAMLENIEQRLHAQELARALEIGQKRLLDVQHQESILRERQRVMQDMHDGLGSSLTSSLVLLERGEISVAGAAVVMRECVEDLRLVVDSLEPTSKDLSTLLGMLRYRLQGKIQAAGVRLHWQMVDLPSLPWLEPSMALDVLRLMQEAIANTLRHAHATDLEITAKHAGDAIELVLRDNGVGFDSNQVRTVGRGMRTMNTRAARLGGQLMTLSVPTVGTMITLRLPIVRRS
jgi:signal transduction histidine kinase